MFVSIFTQTHVHVSAETVSGGGYIVEQIIAPIEGVLSGNGYILNQVSQVNGGINQGGGYNVFSPFGGSVNVIATSTPPSTFSGGGGYYILPVASTSIATSTKPDINTETDQIFTDTSSTCKSRIIFSSPIDIGSSANKVSDVKRLETFLNTYENEKLPINGIYEKRDIDAVKRWQKKYKSFILDPMRLKNPTGTIYTLSMRQIERQTTKECGEAVIITSCPFFRANVSSGNKGEEVKKVQQFLNIVQGEKLPLSGVFGPLTRSAVKRFQRQNRTYVATYIPIVFATGNWYTTTRAKANETIGCGIIK